MSYYHGKGTACDNCPEDYINKGLWCQGCKRYSTNANQQIKGAKE